MSLEVSYQRLICPHCAYPLDPTFARTGIVVCPRCNETMQLESDCFGSCITCRHGSKSNTCATAVTENPDPLLIFGTGQQLDCTVGVHEDGGYAVEAGKERVPGFLATKESLTCGSKINAVVVCIHKGRLLLALADQKIK